MTLALHFDFVNDKSLVGKTGPTLTCVRSGATATYRDANGARQTAAANEARFDHDEAGNSLGLLVEQTRTNLFLNSDAPVTQNITTTAQQYTVTVEGAGTVTLSGTATGVATEGSPLTVTATAGTLTCTVAGSLDTVQVEAGSFGTSYIPTAGSPVQRNADQISTADMTWADTFGTCFVSASHYAPSIFSSQNSALINFDDTLGDDWYIYGRISGGNIRSYYNNINDTDAIIDSGVGSAVADTTFSLAVAVALNDAAMYFDGALSGVDSSVIPDAIFESFLVGKTTSGEYWNGHIKEIAYWDERLDNNTLEGLSNGSIPIGSRAQTYIAITRRLLNGPPARPRMQKPRRTLRSEFE